MTPENLAKRFVVAENGCWVWSRGKFTSGYGAVTEGRKTRKAHRVSYEIHVGKIPAGLTIDHLCRNKPCVNPAHLEAVTGAENTRRARKTHCKRGHELSGYNVQIKKHGRACRACQILHTQAWRCNRRWQESIEETASNSKRVKE